MVNKKIDKKDVLKVIHKLAETIRFNRYINERYFHHAFSHLLQKKYPQLDLTNQLTVKQSDIILHPEWATYRVKDKNVEEIKVPQYRKYKDHKPKSPEGKEGKGAAFDFTIGKYETPYIGIEFKWKYDWEKKPIAFDFMKCLDNAFKFFKTSISYNVIIREKRDIEYLNKDQRKEKFKKTMYDAYKNACNELKKIDALVNNSRDVYIIITEIGNDNNRLHWHYDKKIKEFREGVPTY